MKLVVVSQISYIWYLSHSHTPTPVESTR